MQDSRTAMKQQLPGQIKHKYMLLKKYYQILVGASSNEKRSDGIVRTA